MTSKPARLSAEAMSLASLTGLGSAGDLRIVRIADDERHALFGGGRQAEDDGHQQSGEENAEAGHGALGWLGRRPLHGRWAAQQSAEQRDDFETAASPNMAKTSRDRAAEVYRRVHLASKRDPASHRSAPSHVLHWPSSEGDTMVKNHKADSFDGGRAASIAPEAVPAVKFA